MPLWRGKERRRERESEGERDGTRGASCGDGGGGGGGERVYFEVVAVVVPVLRLSELLTDTTPQRK